MNSEWPLVHLRDFVDLLAGFAFKSSGYTENSDDARLLRGDNIAPGNVRWDGVKRWSNEGVVGLSRYALEPGDVVLAMDRPWIPSGLKVAQIRKSDSPCYLVQRVARLRTSSLQDRNFLFALLSTPDFESYIQNATTGTAVPHISAKQILDYEFNLPPASVRSEVGAFNADINDRITLLRETNATLEAIAQALFKSWFVDFDPVRAKMEGRAPEGMDEATAALFPDSFEETELGAVPKGWRVMPFLEACDLQGGAQPPASTFVDAPRDGYVRLLQIRDFSTDAHKTYIPDTSKLKKSTEDDVLLGRYGSASGDKAKDSLGRVCRGLSGAYNVALMKLVPLQVGREFALQLVNDPRFYNYLQGVSSKAVQSGFSKSELGQYKVTVPPKPLAEAFELIGVAVWERLKHGVARQRELADLRDTLLPRLISGQLRLPEASHVLQEAGVA